MANMEQKRKALPRLYTGGLFGFISVGTVTVLDT